MTDTNTLAPTDAEILDAAEDFRSQYMHGGTTFDEFDEIGFARAVLAKWGTPALASSEPAAVLASGPVGFDHKTAANFLNGKTVTDEEVRQFVAHSRWAHDDRDGLRNTIADLRREIAQRDAEIALLKTSLLDAESPTQAAQVQNAWNPIETAPKDKSNVVLLRQPCGSVANGYFLAEAYAGNGAWIWPYIHKNPTHWMPLPAPPAPIAAQKGDKP